MIRALAATTALALTVTACTRNANAEADNDTIDGVRVEVLEVRDNLDTGAYVIDPGTRWVGIHIEYENTTDHTVDLTTAYAVYLITDQGTDAEHMAGTLPERPAAIPPGRTVTGWHTYELYDGEQPDYLLVYGDDPTGDPTTIDLDPTP